MFESIFTDRFPSNIIAVLQFGFVTMFAAASPLSPLLGLINNCMEIRLDAAKFISNYRRSVVKRVYDIGVWKHIIEFMVYFSCFSNVSLDMSSFHYQYVATLCRVSHKSLYTDLKWPLCLSSYWCRILIFFIWTTYTCMSS